MAFATNEVEQIFHDNLGPEVRAYSIAASTRLLAGTYSIACNGVLYPAGSEPAAKYLSVAGADANGGIKTFAKQGRVRYAQITGGANKTLGVTVAYNASTIDIIVQLATDGGGAVTSTAAQVMQAVLAHATAQSLVQVGFTGTGAGLAAAAAVADVPMTVLVGVAFKTVDNLSNVSAITIPEGFRYHKGRISVAGLSSDLPTAAMIGSQVAFVDDVTVKATPGPLDITATLADVWPNGIIFVDVK